jgi:hypothetical protein
MAVLGDLQRDFLTIHERSNKKSIPATLNSNLELQDNYSPNQFNFESQNNISRYHAKEGQGNSESGYGSAAYSWVPTHF